MLDLVDDLHMALEADLARLAVDLGMDVVLEAIARARRLLDRVFHRHQHDVAVDRLLARHHIGHLKQLEPVETGYRFHRSCSSNPFPKDCCHQGCCHRSEEHTSELQSLMRISYAVFCLKKKTITK